MPYTVTREVRTQVDGRAVNVPITLNADIILGGVDRSGVNAIPVPKTGELTTRTNDTVGTITLDPGHGLVTGRVDLYWTIGGVAGKRRGVAGTVTGDSLAITGGLGDNLPVLNSDILSVNPVVENFGIPTPADLRCLIVQADPSVVTQVVFATAGDAEVLNVPLVGDAYNAYEWTFDTGPALPIGSAVTKVYMSHKDTTSARGVKAHAYGV
jgi:hypothetical protein